MSFAIATNTIAIVPFLLLAITVAALALSLEKINSNNSATSAVLRQQHQQVQPKSKQPMIVRKKQKRRLIWHRNRDLRFHDHPFYNDINDNDVATFGVFVFDETKASTKASTATSTASVADGLRPSTCLPNDWITVSDLGPHGTRVLLESVIDLRNRSRGLCCCLQDNNNNCSSGGSCGDTYDNNTNSDNDDDSHDDSNSSGQSRCYQQQKQRQPLKQRLEQELIVRRGETVPILLGLLQKLMELDNNNNNNNDEYQYLYEYEVCWNEEPGWYELELSNAFKAAISKRYNVDNNNNNVTVTMRTALSCTLYHPEDLPAVKSWQPLSKKEKRRLENQRKKEKQLQRKQPKQQHSPKRSGPPKGRPNNHRNDNDNDDNQHELVRVSPERWVGMPKIMGDFRKIARERAGVRPLLVVGGACAGDVDVDVDADVGAAAAAGRRECVVETAVATTTGTTTNNSNDDDVDDKKCYNPKAKQQQPVIDPGTMPTLESLLEPLLFYVGSDDDDDSNSDDDDDYDDNGKAETKQKKPFLGLPPSIIREVCHHAIRIHHQNYHKTTSTDTTTANASTTTPTLAPTTSTTGAPTTMIGGETAGLAHLADFCRNHSHKAQRSLACVDHHQSSRLGQYLAFGCVSPRKVIEVAESGIRQRQQRGSNDNGNDDDDDYENDGTWLISHMTMRDFFLYTCLASGKQFYRLKGIPVNEKHAQSIEWKPFFSGNNNNIQHKHESSSSSSTSTSTSTSALDQWKAWATGTTGLPLVDACMRELIRTGYASNRVRQNAASVLAKDLGLDWRAGAEWFQFLLSDHCVAANWGNWLYFSGVGPDPKQRHFCTVSQALKYDAGGTYVRKWLPELENPTSSSSSSTKSATTTTTTTNTNTNTTITNHRHHGTTSDDNDADINVGVNHPEFHLRPWDFDPSWKKPIVDPQSQYTWRDLKRLKETGRLTE